MRLGGRSLLLVRIELLDLGKYLLACDLQLIIGPSLGGFRNTSIRDAVHAAKGLEQALGFRPRHATAPAKLFVLPHVASGILMAGQTRGDDIFP
jgi:hypothetical protein